MTNKEMQEKAKNIVKKLSIEQKAKLLTGEDFWHVHGVSDFGLEHIQMSDGPHGLRKQEGKVEKAGMNDAVPATCFPAAVTMACSFDRELMYEVGMALGEQCLHENISILLGPGVNHKRSPLCGRNFEYFSEDPVLSGELAAEFVNGVQSKGVGTSLKHFAVNNQEYGRMHADSVVDERTLREIYLKQFEIIVKKSQPYTIMGAYNKLNGTFCCENRTLLDTIAREEWGFKGVFVSDWGAMNDPIESFNNGLDLEMPGVCKGADRRVLEAIRKGKFSPDTLDRIAERQVNLLLKAKQKSKPEFSEGKERYRLDIAQKVLEESAVLLKNEGILPINKNQKIAVIGRFAKEPRFQGSGSSKINPIEKDNFCEALQKSGIAFDYADGYEMDGSTNDVLLQKASNIAKGKDCVIVFAGLPDSFESEGYDRKNIELPEGHNALICNVAKCNQNIIVVLQSGSVISMPWLNQTKAVLHTFLGGCQSGIATMRLLYGDVNPSGKLAESYPFKLKDSPCAPWYLDNDKICEYREGIYTGYRYYDSANISVQFPFGFGLSYTEFAYTSLSVTKSQDDIHVAFDIRNIGKRTGKEIAQIYVGHNQPTIFKAKKELKDFVKVELEPGETKHISIVLKQDSFAYFNTNIHKWHVESGMYSIMVGSSSAEIRLKDEIYIEGDDSVVVPNYHDVAEIYYHPEKIHTVTQEDFAVILGHQVPTKQKVKKPYTWNVTVNELAESSRFYHFITPLFQKVVNRFTKDDKDMGDTAAAVAFDTPIRAFGMVGGMSRDTIDGLVAIINGHIIKGIRLMKKKGDSHE